MHQQKNFILFLVLSFLLFIVYVRVKDAIWPPPKPAPANVVEKTPAKVLRGLVLGGSGTVEAAKKEWIAPVVRRGLVLGPVAALRLQPPLKNIKFVRLGSDDPHSRFHLQVVFDPRVAGVSGVLLNKFQAADNDGKAVWKDKDKKEPAPLELVSRAANLNRPSSLLYHFDVNQPNADHPLDTLGDTDLPAWRQVGDVVQAKTEDERERQRVSFEAEVQGVIVTKTFTLTEGEYHIGLEVKLQRAKDADKAVKFRYQLTGFHGLPVEGKYYTSTFRNALIGRVNKKDNVLRDIQETRQIALRAGGDAILKDEDNLIRYAAVVVQYFASAIVVDNDQPKQDFLAKARPTLETAVAKGIVRSIGADGRFELEASDKSVQTFLADPSMENPILLQERAKVAVIYHTDSHFHQIATALENEAQTQPLWVDDVTVRVATEPVELKPGETVTHKYLLYNGPVKPMLLGKMTGDEAVPEELVNRYVETLHLNTFTDYQSSGWAGSFSSTIGWSFLIIKCTNLMHHVLGLIHKVIPNFGVCIIVLTVLVRGLMFPISRKQALTTMKMQELAPEIKALQQKYKDDRQELGKAQMALYRKHGVNPFGTCWFLLLQMPIFMGLYYALQESIFFRLAPFWPTWITNLAAPDMLVRWGESIPWLSRPEDYGGFFYLGPYLNLLPVIAVSLMLVQQKMMTPPPTDEQQEMQQKIMKYMMIFFGLLFYKVAAGLCVYFIASSVWGFAERRLLPKKKVQLGTTSAEGLFQRMLGRGEDEGRPAASTPSTAVTTNGGAERGKGRKKAGRGKRRPESAPASAPGGGTPERGGSMLQRLRAWWADVLKQAEKK